MVDWDQHIEVNPGVMFGKPVIARTRIPVEIVLRKLAAQMTPEEIIAEYPALTPEDIFAALAYASDVVASEDIVVSGGSR